jgi:hypothetical protein
MASMRLRLRSAMVWLVLAVVALLVIEAVATGCNKGGLDKGRTSNSMLPLAAFLTCNDAHNDTISGTLLRPYQKPPDPSRHLQNTF